MCVACVITQPPLDDQQPHPPHRIPCVLQVRTRDDVLTCARHMHSDALAPIFLTSSVTVSACCHPHHPPISNARLSQRCSAVFCVLAIQTKLYYGCGH